MAGHSLDLPAGNAMVIYNLWDLLHAYDAAVMAIEREMGGLGSLLHIICILLTCNIFNKLSYL